MRAPLDAEVIIERLLDEGYLAGIAAARRLRGNRPRGRAARRGHRAAHQGRDRRIRGRLRKGGPMSSEAGGRQPGGRAPRRRSSGRETEPTLFEIVRSRDVAPIRCGRRGCPNGGPRSSSRPRTSAPKPVALPEVAERDLVGHFTRLSHRQYSVDLGAYPLGSCTMKYNPKLCDEAASMPRFRNVHPATAALWLAGLAPGPRRARRGALRGDRHGSGDACSPRPGRLESSPDCC